jgi:hypothetical protein
MASKRKDKHGNVLPIDIRLRPDDSGISKYSVVIKVHQSDMFTDTGIAEDEGRDPDVFRAVCAKGRAIVVAWETSMRRSAAARRGRQTHLQRLVLERANRVFAGETDQRITLLQIARDHLLKARDALDGACSPKAVQHTNEALDSVIRDVRAAHSAAKAKPTESE